MSNKTGKLFIVECTISRYFWDQHQWCHQEEQIFRNATTYKNIAFLERKPGQHLFLSGDHCFFANENFFKEKMNVFFRTLLWQINFWLLRFFRTDAWWGFLTWRYGKDDTFCPDNIERGILFEQEKQFLATHQEIFVICKFFCSLIFFRNLMDNAIFMPKQFFQIHQLFFPRREVLFTFCWHRRFWGHEYSTFSSAFYEWQRRLFQIRGTFLDWPLSECFLSHGDIFTNSQEASEFLFTFYSRATVTF